jgi:uncharacterized membrane protein SpoIIM required for sporulation
MVLESLLWPLKAEKKPWEMFFIALLYSSVAVFLSLWIFEKQASFVMVFFIVLASIPIVYTTFKFEESKDLKLETESKIIREHNRAIFVLAFWFLGLVVAGVVWYVFLPSQTVTYLYNQQISTISDINNRVSASATGLAIGSDALFKILFNNLKVLIFCILFSFVYGMGAIFILAWNATVISAAIGNFIKSGMSAVLQADGVGQVTGYFTLVMSGFLKYSIHGIPEIMAYLYGGFAGGIISLAIARNHFSTEKASNILLDVGELVLIAMGFLVIGAIFEVYVTPALF